MKKKKEKKGKSTMFVIPDKPHFHHAILSAARLIVKADWPSTQAASAGTISICCHVSNVD